MTEAPSLRTTLATLSALRSFRYLALGAGFTAFVTYGTGNFGPSFLARTYHLGSGEIGTILGLVGGIAGMCGTFLGGFLGDRFGGRDARWYLWVPALCLTAAVPLRILGYAVDDLRLATILTGATELLALTYLGPVIAMSHAMVPPAMRAFTSSVLFLALNLIGLGLGPLFTGLVSDALTHRMGPDAIRWAMAATCLAGLPAAACFYLASRTLRQDIATTTT